MQVRTDTELDLDEIDIAQPVDKALQFLHGDVVISQAYTGTPPQPRRVPARRAEAEEPLHIRSVPLDIAQRAAAGGKAAARDAIAGGDKPAVSPPADDVEMHDEAAEAGGASDEESEGAIENGHVTDTAFDFLQQMHSLRRITCMPLPGSQVRAAPAAATPADSADGSAPAAPAPQALPRMEIEVQKDASYADVVVAISDKLEENGIAACAPDPLLAAEPTDLSELTDIPCDGWGRMRPRASLWGAVGAARLVWKVLDAMFAAGTLVCCG